jgi:hypothetical protein
MYHKKEELVLDGTMDPNRGLYLVPLYHYGKENRALAVSPMNTAQKTLKTAQVSNIVPQPLKRALMIKCKIHRVSIRAMNHILIPLFIMKLSELELVYLLKDLRNSNG